MIGSAQSAASRISVICVTTSFKRERLNRAHVSVTGDTSLMEWSVLASGWPQSDSGRWGDGLGIPSPTVVLIAFPASFVCTLHYYSPKKL